ncbi:hypothetical protein FH972_009577 [Carpinus fangiana]|uniref:Uncharacterized protein n=1 Tax=Carpinus fangiana TaxID=176857 RepID=A0A660KSL6_9ROSI|nr:hypothetical protein FH972_009577 [Carpinus fangiana]
MASHTDLKSMGRREDMMVVCIAAPKLGSDEEFVPGVDKAKAESIIYGFPEKLLGLVKSSSVEVSESQLDCMKNIFSHGF